jgi:hypothetical protein
MDNNELEKAIRITISLRNQDDAYIRGEFVF